MADIYGNLIGAGAYGYPSLGWQAYATYTVSESATEVTVTLNAAGMRSVGWGLEIRGVTTSASLSGMSPVSGGGAFYSAWGSYVSTSFASGSWTIAKGTSARSVTLSVTTENWGGYLNGSSTATAAIAVPALASHAVSYDANGGTGAPAGQTKWYGSPLTLSSVRPTRAGHSFLGWATSASGQPSYQPGGSYTADASVTLYAVWRLDYVGPTISGLSASRVNSSGAAADTGTYMRVRASWAVSTAVSSSNRATGLKVEYKLASSSSWTTASSSRPGTASGTLDLVTGGGRLDSDYVYDVRVTVSDSGGSTSATTQLTAAFYLMDVGNGGRTVAFGQAASSTPGFECAMDARFSGSLQNDGMDVQVLGYALAGNDADFGGDVSRCWRRFASCTVSAEHTDSAVRFAVASNYGPLDGYGGKFGTLVAHVRTGSGLRQVDAAELYWEGAGASVDPADFVLCHKLTAGSSLYVELWCRSTTSWQCLSFTVLTDASRVEVHPAGWGWELYRNTEGGKGSTGAPGSSGGYTQVSSKVAPLNPGCETRSFSYGCRATRNAFGVVTVSGGDAGTVTIPAAVSGVWSRLELGSLPAGWRPASNVRAQVLMITDPPAPFPYLEITADTGAMALVNPYGSAFTQSNMCWLATFVAAR